MIVRAESYCLFDQAEVCCERLWCLAPNWPLGEFLGCGEPWLARLRRAPLKRVSETERVEPLSHQVAQDDGGREGRTAVGEEAHHTQAGRRMGTVCHTHHDHNLRSRPANEKTIAFLFPTPPLLIFHTNTNAEGTMPLDV